MTYRELPRWMRVWIALAFVILLMCFLLFAISGVFGYIDGNGE